MPPVSLIVGAAVLWVTHALAVAFLLDRRGFHRLPWLATSLLLGPAIWPLALIEIWSGPPRRELLRAGQARAEGIDVFVLFESNHAPDPTLRQIRRIGGHRRRLVFARVIKAGGPVYLGQEAGDFLRSLARRADPDAELQILYGDMGRATDEAHLQGADIVLRSDHPHEIYDGDGGAQEVRCVRDAPAA